MPPKDLHTQHLTIARAHARGLSFLLIKDELKTKYLAYGFFS